MTYFSNYRYILVIRGIILTHPMQNFYIASHFPHTPTHTFAHTVPGDVRQYGTQKFASVHKKCVNQGLLTKKCHLLAKNDVRKCNVISSNHIWSLPSISQRSLALIPFAGFLPPYKILLLEASNISNTLSNHFHEGSYGLQR